jgi:hypothetical protein
MATNERRALHALIDTLPTRELPAARRFLEFLRKQPGELHAAADAKSVNTRRAAPWPPEDVEGLFTLDWSDERAGASAREPSLRSG